MKILDGYIARHVTAGALLALAVLLSLTAVVTFVEELGSVGRGRYGIVDAIEFTALTLPRQAFVLFPLAAVIGALMGLGALAVSSELGVVRAAGVSIGRIVGSVLKGAALLVGFAVLLGEFVAPYCERIAETKRAAALHGSTARASGFWIRDGSRFVNVRRILSDNQVEDMFIYELDAGGRLQVAMHAEEGVYRNAKWILDSVRRSDVSEAGTVARTSSREVWPARFGPELVKLTSARLESLSGRALVRYIDYLEENRLEIAAYELALWRKIVYPLATGMMIFLAVPLVLGRLGGARVGQRILVGCLIAVAFHVINEISGKAGIVYGLNPALGAFAPVAAFLVAGMWMLRQVR